MDGPCEHHSKWNQPVPPKVQQILYYYINFLKLCMHAHATTPVWRSEDNFWQWVLSLLPSWFQRVNLGPWPTTALPADPSYQWSSICIKVVKWLKGWVATLLEAQWSRRMKKKKKKFQLCSLNEFLVYYIARRAQLTLLHQILPKVWDSTSRVMLLPQYILIIIAVFF